MFWMGLIMEDFRDKMFQALECAHDMLKTDEAKKAFERSCYLAGGAIWSLYHNEKPNDYDIFCRTPQDMYTILKDLGTADFATDNAFTYISKKGELYQFILKVFGEPMDVIVNFDFEHNMFAYDYKKQFFYVEMAPLYKKVLTVNTLNKGDLNLVVCRAIKFCERGFIFSEESMALLLLRLQEQGGIKVDVLQEYLRSHGYL
jgi:hypothetical protein